MSKINKWTLPNGVRVLSESVPYVQSAAIGLWCRTGSVNEVDNEGGITHLIEHMLFKGTKNRTAREIAETIEGRGGSMNAFTDKEATCYYCRVLADEVETGIDVLSDMMINSILEPEELDREKRVVLEEIKRGEDEPSEHVHDLHLQYRWPNHPLGKSIIGTRESVSSFERNDVTNYMDRRYRAENVLLAIAGNVDCEKIHEIAMEKLASIPSTTETSKFERPTGSKQVNLVSKNVEQVHFCIGTDGCSLHDQDRLYVLAVLDNALGGSMSSRIFQEVREKRGLVYSVGSYSLTYSVGGTYTVFGGTGQQTWDEVQEVIRSEFDKVMENGLHDDELERTKRNISGGLVLGLEGMSGRMMRMSRNELNHGREIPIEETLAKIEAVTNDKIIELARDILDEERISTTAIGPFG